MYVCLPTRKLHLNSPPKKKTVKARTNATFRTSSSSVVLTLPKAMRNFVQTRDGQGNVVVRTESLKRQFQNLYYESPVNPTQVFSNSFILQMAAKRMKWSSSKRECELWCRKERSKHTNLLMAIAKSPTIDACTTYYKSQSANGIFEIAKFCFPEIVALKENGIQPKRNHYEHLCKFVDKCQDALSLAEAKAATCNNEIQKTLKENKQVKEGTTTTY